MHGKVLLQNWPVTVSKTLAKSPGTEWFSWICKKAVRWRHCHESLMRYYLLRWMGSICHNNKNNNPWQLHIPSNFQSAVQTLTNLRRGWASFFKKRVYITLAMAIFGLQMFSGENAFQERGNVASVLSLGFFTSLKNKTKPEGAIGLQCGRPGQSLDKPFLLNSFLGHLGIDATTQSLWQLIGCNMERCLRGILHLYCRRNKAALILRISSPILDRYTQK